MSFFGTIGKDIAKATVGEVFDSVEEITKAYFNKEISKEEYETKRAAINATFHNQATALLSTMVKSDDPFVRRAMPAAFWSTLFIQVWYSWIQPFGVATFGSEIFPVLKPGDTVQWNFVLLLGILGLHPTSIAGKIGSFFKKD